MPFGRRARYVRAFTYGCRRPIAGRDVALQTMRARTHLWNALVELDHRAKDDLRAILAPYLPPEPAPLATDADGEQKKAHRAAWRAQRTAVLAREDIRARLDALARRVYEESKTVKNATPLWWHNRDTVQTDWLRARRSPRPLCFHASGRSGSVVVTWSHGRPVADLWGDRTLRPTEGLLIAPVDPGVWDRARYRAERQIPPDLPPAKDGWRSYRDHARWTTARLLVDPTSEVVVPVAFDRPLPEGGILRMAHLTWTRISPRVERWTLSLAVETPEPTPTTLSGVIAIDLGWRKQSDGSLRVATWRDSEGRAGDVRLSPVWLERMALVDDLRAIRDRHYDAIQADLLAWLRENDAIVPGWLREATKDLARSTSTAKLATLVREWREQRFGGDEAIFERLMAGWDPAIRDYRGWEPKDAHLLEWEANMRNHLLMSRREQYRRFAAWVARTYGRVVIEEFDLMTMQDPEYWIPNEVIRRFRGIKGKNWKDALRADIEAHPELYEPYRARRGQERPDDTTRFFALDPTVRRQRVRAACSALRRAIVNAVERDGGTVTIVPATDTTRRCPVCSERAGTWVNGIWEDPAALVQTCQRCTTTYSDQDIRAAETMLTIL